MDNNNLRSLHKTLQKAGYNPPPYDQFARDMEDDNNLRGVYSTLKKEGYTPPAYDQFKNDMGFGGQAAAPSAPAQQRQAQPPTQQVVRQVQQPPAVNARRAGTTQPQPAQQRRQASTKKKKQPYRPSAQQWAATQNMFRQSDAMFANFRQRSANMREWRNQNPLRMRGDGLRLGARQPRVLGGNKNVVRGQDRFNPRTGKMEARYITPSGDEFSTEIQASNFQNRVEHAQYRQEHPLEADMQDAYMERDRLDREIARRTEELNQQNRQRDAGQSWMGSFAASLANAEGPGYSGSWQNERVSDPELSMLWTAKRKNEQRIKTLEREKNQDGFWTTLGKTLFSVDTWDFGAQELRDAGNLAMYGDMKMPKGAHADAQEAMMRNTYLQQVADQQWGENDTFMQRAGEITGQAIPFVVEFMATGGFEGLTAAGTKLGSRAAARWATGKVGRWVLKNTGTLAGDMAAGFLMANTTGAMKTGADIINRHQGYVIMDENGDYKFEGGKSWGRSIYEGEMANTLEYYTEKLGVHLDGGGKIVGNWLGKGMERIGAGRVSELLSRITGSEWSKATGQLLRRGGIQDYPSEVIEEQANLLMNALLVGDNNFSLSPIKAMWDGDIDKESDEYKKSIFNPKTQADIWGGMLLSIGFMRGVHDTAQYYYRFKHKTDVSDRLAGFRLTADKWEPWRERIDNTTNADMMNVVTDVLGDENLSPQKKEAVMGYVGNLMKMRGYNLRTTADAKDQLNETDEDGNPVLPDPEVTAVNEAFRNGYNMEDDAEMQDARNRMVYLHDQLTEFVSDDMMSQFDDDPMGALSAIRDNEQWTDDEKQAALDYVNARTIFNGMVQRVRDDIDTEIAASDAMIDSRVFRGAANPTADEEAEQAAAPAIIIPATLKERDEEGNDKQVYIVSGNVQMLDDGTMVDTENSDQNIVVVDAESGKVSMISINDILNVDEALDAEQVKEEARNDIVNVMSKQASDRIDGTLPFMPGDNYMMMYPDDGSIHNVQIAEDLGDGTVSVLLDDAQEPTVMSKEDIQGFADKYRIDTLQAEDSVMLGAEDEEQAEDNTPDYALNDVVSLQTDEGTVRGQISNEANEDGLIEVYTEKPIGGKKINLFTREQLNSMLVDRQPATQPATQSNAGVQPGTEQLMPEQQVIQQGINNVGEGLRDAMNEQASTIRENDINNWLQRPEVIEALRPYADGAHSVDNMVERALADTTNEDVKAALQDILRFPSSRKLVADTFTETPAPVAENEMQPADIEAGTEEPQQPAEPMPMREVGTGKNAETEPDWLAVTPERGHDWLFGESGLDRADANEIVTNNLEAAQKAVEKASKLKPKKTTNPFTLQAERERIAGEQAAAQNALDYWKTVQSRQTALRNAELEQSRAEQAERDRIAHEQAVAAEEARQAEVLAQREEQAQRGAHAVHPAIREKWEAASKVEGFESELPLSDGTTVKGRYMLVESGAVTPSHNAAMDFARSEGFPVDENGNTINDRDYERDRDAQDVTREMGRTFDSRAIQDTPVVSRDGVVLSGNGRTMAGELAARDNTDGAYLDHLTRFGRQYGFTPEQVSSMQHPRLVFVADEDMPYTTETFAKFNAQQMKSQDRTETAVKLGKTVPDNTFGRIVGDINRFDTLSQFYNDPKASVEAINDLRRSGVINPMQYAEMFDGKKVSVIGRQMLENMLLGKAFESNPDALRELAAYPQLRQSVIAALAEISNNKRLGDYSLEDELSEAIHLAYIALGKGMKQGDIVSNIARQLNLFPFDLERGSVVDYTNASILMLADVLNSTEVNKLRNVLALYNDRAGTASNGNLTLDFDADEAGSGFIESKSQIIKDVLNLIENGERKEKQRAIDEARERRKDAAEAEQGDSGTEQDGTVERSDSGEQPAGNADERQGDLAQTEITAPLSDEVNEFGKPFVLSSDGTTTFGEVDPESGLKAAPIKLSLGENRVDEDGKNHGYGLLHIKAGHAKEILERFSSIEEFVETVARNYDTIREGGVIADNQTYLLEISDEHNNTLFIQLSRDGSYWNVNSAGIFNKKYSRRKQKVLTRPALEPDTNTDTSGVDSGRSEGVTTPAGNSPRTSEDKGSENSETGKEKTEKVAESKASTAIAEAEQEVAAHPDALFLVRGQKLYKAYGEDAKKLGEILGVEVKPDKKYGFVASFDNSDLDTNLPKLVRAGLRVAITDTSVLKDDKPASGKKKTTKAADIAAEQTPASGEGKSGYTVEPAQYTTKRGKVLDMVLVKFGRELTTDEKQALTKLAKEKRGWWDREKGGFLMRDEATARQLGDMVGDEEAVKDNQPMSLADVQAVNDAAAVQAVDEAIKVEEKPQSTPQYDYDREDEVYDQVLAGLRETLNNANGNAIPNIKAIEKKIRELRKSITNVDNGLATAGEDTIGKAYETLATLTGRMKAYEKFLAELRKKMSETERDDALAARGVKLGDKVTYKGKQATIHDADARQVTLDVGLSPVLYEVTDWENVELPKQEPTTPQVNEVNVESLMGELNERGEAKLSDHATPVEEEQPQTEASEPANETANEKSEYGSNNRLVSRDRYEEIKRRMRKKMGGQANMGLDPELIAMGAEMAVFHIEAGARKFVDFAKRMIADMGDSIRPYLKMFYNSAREMPEAVAAGLSSQMDDYATVSSIDVANLDKPTVDAMATAEQIVNEQRVEQQAEEATNEIIKQRNADRKEVEKERSAQEKSSKSKKNKKNVVTSQQRSLFGDLYGEAEQEAEQNNDDNGLQGTDEPRSEGLPAEEVQPSESSGRESETTGEGVGQESRGTDDVGGGRSHGASGSLQSGLHGLEQSPKRNTNNNHAERGKDYAPKDVDARIEANIAAIELMQKLMDSGKRATAREMAVLRKFSGWGGLGKAFNESSWGWRSDAPPHRLRKLLGDEGFEQANMSRNSAYYTPAKIIDALWDIARSLGFKGGRVLEGSAGIGNILGLMPRDLSERSDIHAVEIDSTTGNILSLLYPDAQVDVQGFEATRIANGSVDLAITNVPFVTGLHVIDETGDGDLSKKFRDIHDFCIAKNIRKLREGGIGIFITSSGTLDNSQKLRDWITSEGNADVVGAFRLNNETFGGTSATSDIIIVRKRVNGKKSAHAIDVSRVTGERTATYETGKTKKVKGEYVPETRQLSMDYNQYFIEHPEMMGGVMAFGFEQGNTYRPTSRGLFPKRGISQEKRLADFVSSFADKEWDEYEAPTTTIEDDNVYDELGEGIKEGSMLIDSNGNLCVASYGLAVPLDVNANKIKGHTKQECFRAYSEIKDAVQAVLDYQTEHDDDAGLQPLLDRLNKVFDDFVNTYGHFHALSGKPLAISFLRNDVDFSSIAALEKKTEYNDENNVRQAKFEKSDIFNKRVVEKETEPKPTTVRDGVITSIYKFGRVDVPYISEQLGMSEGDVKQAIIDGGLGYENPLSREMEVSYEYLSGNVREKLQQAREANENGDYDANIKALEAVIPMDIPAHLIEFTLGSSWLDPKLYVDYIRERTGLNVTVANIGGTWVVKEPYNTVHELNRAMAIESEKCGKVIWGHELITAALQNKTIRVTKSITRGYGSSKTTETIVDEQATAACAAKIDEIRQDFKDWAREKMQSDPALSEEVERTYNERFNNYVPKEIPDTFVPEYFSGASHSRRLRPHQAKAAIRATTQPLMLAHEVGTGKTMTLITTAMEMRRLGTARKPMIVVFNATLAQFVASAKKLYPKAKILALEDSDKSAEGRKAFYAKIKYNDWDMIIIPQSALDKIPDSEERQIAFVKEKIEEKLIVLEQIRETGDDNLIKEAEKELEKLNEDLAALSEAASEKRKKRDKKKEAVTKQNAEVKAREMLDRRVDDVEDFDAMGIDALLVDEAHSYKHLGFATAMQRGVKGVDPSFSKRSQGVYLKCQSVMERTGGKNVVFATGTPISNTAAEIWTFMRYLMPADVMREYGIYYFDDFVRNFGNLTQMLEFATNGKFKEVNRFAGYVNLPELVRIWSSVCDTVLTDEASDLKSKIPELEGGKATDIYLPQTRALRSVMKYVNAELRRFENMSGKEKKANSHIPLTMYGIAKAAAVDPRLVLDDAVDEPDSKTNEAVRQTLRSLEETAEYRGTVAIFSDVYQNKRSGFNLYEDIRRKLIEAGVPAEQVVVMRSGIPIKKKLEIFDKVRSGEIRVILGSTFTLGTGVNIQERLHTLIHLDAPNRPMDYTQRNGRILRQGNIHKQMGKPVRILRFGVEDSLDVTAYQRLKTKGAIADSIMHGKQLMGDSMENRTMEEEEDVFGDVVAQLSGSEYAMLKQQAEREVRRLRAKQKQHEADQIYIHNQKPRLRGQIAASRKLIEESERSLSLLKDVDLSKGITIGKQHFSGAEAMGDFYKEYNKKLNDIAERIRGSYMDEQGQSQLTVSIGGFDFTFRTDLKKETERSGGTLKTVVRKKMTYSCEALGLKDVPVERALLRNGIEDIVKNVLSGNDFKERIEASQRSITRNEEQLATISERDGKPFELAAELADAEARLADYEEKMKAEMEAKEAKYADVDADVDAADASSISYDDSDEGGSDSDENMYREDEDEEKSYRSKKNLLEDDDIPEIIATFVPADNLNKLAEPIGILENADAEEWVERHKEALLRRCRELASPENVLDPDAVRNILQLIGYNGRNVPAYKKAGNILVAELFKRQMSEAVSSGNPTITFMSGIGGAGKGTTLRKGGIDTSGRGVVYDAAFNDMIKLFRKMKEAAAAGMTDIEVLVVHNDALTAFKNTVNRGRSMGRFLGVNYFLTSYEERKGLVEYIAERAHELGVHVTIRPLDNSNNAGRGEISIEQANAEWDYNPEHYIEDILKYLYDEIQQGRLTENQIASVAGDISEIEQGRSLSELANRLAERIRGRVLSSERGDIRREVPERVERLDSDEEQSDEGGAGYREVTDEEHIAWLEKQPTVKVYRSMVLIDGKLYPPMSSKDNATGKLRNAEELGRWTEAVERPEFAYKRNGKWYFDLKKSNGKDTNGVLYNPYIHTSTTMLNDQFAESQSRGDLVVVEMEVPVSELEGLYQAERANDAVGAKSWNAGVIQKYLTGTRDVILTRWAKPVRIVSTEEVADHIFDMIDGRIEVMPTNVVTPQVRAALEARGVKFVETDNKGRVLHGAHAGETWSSSYGKRNKKAVRSKKQERVDNTGLIPARAQQLGTKLGVKVRLIQSRSELPSSWSEKQKRRRKGWYNKATGEVVIVVPNNNSIADVEATVLHEIVGHKGLRELFGKDFDAFLGNVFNNVDEETRRKIVDRAMRNGWDFKKATEEYLASLAESTDFENEVNRSAWQKIKDFFMELLRKAGIMLSRPLTDADLRYILWRSYQRRVEQGAMGVAADVVMRERLGVDGEGAAERDEMMFRDDDFSVRDRAVARDEYERMVSSGSYQFQEAVQDSMLGLKRLYQSILGKETRIEDIAGNENAYLAENRMSSVNAAEQHEYYIRYMKPLLEAISKIAGKSEAERARLSDYMMAKHGLERNLVLAERDAREAEAAGGDYNDAYASCRERDYAGLTALTGEADVAAAEAAAQQIVDDYERAHDTTDLWQRVNDATSATLEKIYRSGLLSVERYQQIQQMFENYIPLQGWDETTSDEVYGYLTSKYGPLTGSPIKRAQGRSSKADDPIATIALMADTAIRQGNRNKMKQTFLNFVLNHPSDLVSVNSLWLQYNAAMDEWEPVFADIEPTDTAADVERKVEAFEARMEQLAEDEPDKYKRGRDAQSIPYKVVRDNMREHQVLVKRGGETYVLTINGNPRAAQALNGLTNPDVEVTGFVGSFLRGVQTLNRNLSAFYTTRNPDFIVSNFFRDMLYSNCMTWVKESPRYALRFHWNFGRVNPIRLRGLLAKWEKGTLDDSNYIERNFKLFMQNGGETGYTNVRDIEGHKRTIIRELKRMKGNIAKAAWRLLGVQFDLLNRSAENCARFAAFLTSRELGRSIERSVYDAKEVSVNFNKKGAGDKMLNSVGQTKLGKFGSYVSGGGRLLYVFWNAGVQGSTNFMRQAKRHPFKFTAGAASMFVLGAVIPILAKAMGGDDDDDENAYYNLPEYVRRSNIIINAGDQWIAIPLPIEFRALYGLGELSTGVVSGNERYSGSELAYNIGSQVSQIMPLDMLEGGGGLNPFIPSAAKPFVEAYWLNKNWTGLPIYKDTPWNKDDPEWTKAYKSANTYLVSGAQWLNELSGGDEYRKGWIDINPSKVEYLLSGMFGGVFTTTDKLVKMGETAIGSRDFDWRNMLIANRVVKTGDERTANRKLTNEYYKYKDSYEDTKRLLKKYGEKAESDEAYRSRLESLMQSDDYLIYEVFDNYQPLFDVLYDAKKGADENTVKTIENEERVLRREMIDLLHEIEDDKHPDYNQRVDAMLKREFSGGGLTQQKAGSVIAKRMGGKDTYGSPDTEYGEIYLQKRDYFDLAEDVLLQSEWKKAKDSGDTERASAIDKARKELTTIKKGKHTKSANIPGLGEGDDDKVMEQLRTRRREILKEFGITPQQTNR